jgi:hypothetical protein
MISDKRLRRIMNFVLDPATRTAHVHCDAPAIAVVTLPMEPEPKRVRVCMKHRRLYNKVAKGHRLELVAESFVGGLCEFVTVQSTIDMHPEKE